MEDKGKVSIIIGCYNVSKWLEEKQLSCIRNQTYTNLEILLINDGSTDNTLSICENLREMDSRIIIISKENGGLGTARNTGLENATGDFVWFYDVDDEAELDLIEKNISWMEDNHTDMNIFSYWCFYPSQELNQEIRFKDQLITNNEQLKSIFLDELMFVPNGNGFVWNKFYRRSFVEGNKFRFGDQRIQQDELFNTQQYILLDRVFITSELLYHYHIYNTGNIRSRFIPNRYDIFITIYKGLEDFGRKWSVTDSRFYAYIINRLYAGMNNSIRFNSFHKDALYSYSERKNVVLDILNRPESRKCIDEVDTSHFSIEQRLFYNAYKQKSFAMIYGLRMLFRKLRKIKHILGRHIT